MNKQTNNRRKWKCLLVNLKLPVLTRTDRATTSLSHSEHLIRWRSAEEYIWRTERIKSAERRSQVAQFPDKWTVRQLCVCWQRASLVLTLVYLWSASKPHKFFRLLICTLLSTIPLPLLIRVSGYRKWYSIINLLSFTNTRQTVTPFLWYSKASIFPVFWRVSYLQR